MKEKLLKGLLKNRIKLTQSVLVIFLITGTIGYGIEVSEDLFNDELIVNKDGNGIDVIEDGIDIFNSGIISGFSYSGNGERPNHQSSYGNGISSYNGYSYNSDNNNSTIGDINNSGIISGFSYSYNSDNSDNSERPNHQSSYGNGISSYNGFGYDNDNNNSTIGDINNSGIISGFSYSYNSDNSERPNHQSSYGNGISSYNGFGYDNDNNNSTIGDINNSGIISGFSYSDNSDNSERPNHQSSYGNGISSYNGYGYDNDNKNSTIGDVNNSGIISGFSYSYNSERPNPESSYGNGISSYNGYGNNNDNKNSTIGDINNSGIISGFSYVYGQQHNFESSNGNGISSYNGYDDGNIGNINNNGVIKGSNYAIYGDFLALTNNGVLAGQSIVSSSESFQRNGIEILLDSDGDILSIENGVDGIVTLEDGAEKVIINVGIDLSHKDSYITVASDIIYENNIINGAGNGEKGVLDISSNVAVTATDTIINAYKTAITLNSEASFEGENIILNGSGLKNEDPIVILKDNANFSLNGLSILNGDLTGAKNINISLGNATTLNGNLSAESGTLNLGNGTDEELRLFHNINGFSTINISGNVTTFETSTISSGDIHINGNFTVRVDGTKADDAGRIVGHALYNHTGKIIIDNAIHEGFSPDETLDIDSESKLNFKVSGLGVDTVIAMNGTDLSEVNDWRLGTYSIAHTAIKEIDDFGNLTGDIKIAIANFDDIFFADIETPEPPDIPDEGGESIKPPILINEHKGIYDSIAKSGELGHLAPTIDAENKTKKQAKVGLLSLLDQIYANNPYIQSAKLSQENLGLFREEILSTKMPELGEWIVEGHGVYSLDDYRNSKSVSLGSTSIKNEYSNELVTNGLLGTGEYGIRENTSLGFAVGGSYQNLDMSMNSKLKGEAIYLGAYGKKKVDNFTFTGGVGYQYGQYDGTRTILNEYQSIRNKGKVKTESFDIYGEAKYTFQDKKGNKVEPKLKLVQSFITQKSVSESNGALAIDMDKERYSIPEVEIGVDFLKPIDIKTGKLESIFGLGVAKTFGKNDNYGTGKIKNSTSFEVEGPDFNDTKLRISAGLRYEYTNGMEYSVGLGVDISKDTDKEIDGRLGVGYRF